MHWSSKFVSEGPPLPLSPALTRYMQYDTSDPSHTGTPSSTKIRTAHTSDFKTFTSPTDYIDYSPTNVIDLTFLALGANAYARFVKNESATNVFTEVSADGLFGTWTRPGGADAIIEQDVEGPAAFWDNEVEGRAYLLLDFFGAGGYAPFVSGDVEGGVWAAAEAGAFPEGLRHGSVVAVDQEGYDALGAAFA